MDDGILSHNEPYDVGDASGSLGSSTGPGDGESNVHDCYFITLTVDVH